MGWLIPHHFSLTAHNQAAIVSSCPASATSLGLQSEKYSPVTVSKSGSIAAYIEVWAPALADFIKGHKKGFIRILQENSALNSASIDKRKNSSQSYIWCNLLGQVAVEETHVAAQFRMNDTWVEGIYSYPLILKPLRKFSGE